MRFVTFSIEEPGEANQEIERVGALHEDGVVVDLSEAFGSMLELIGAGAEGLKTAERMLSQAAQCHEGFTLKAPLPVPEQMRDCMAFHQHVAQATRQAVTMKLKSRKLGRLAPLVNALGLVGVPDVWFRQPLYYKCNRFSVAGPDDDVLWPSYSKLMDFETEIACVIGRKGRDISRSNAIDHIFGFTIYNDFSARDTQFDEMEGRLGPAKGKDFDGGNVLGPFIATPDEFANFYNLEMRAAVNGETWGVGTTADMHHRFEDIIAHISNSETLYPGEVIGSGTVGNGCGLEHGRFLQPDDLVELTVEGLGTLRNHVRQ